MYQDFPMIDDRGDIDMYGDEDDHIMTHKIEEDQNIF